MTFAIKNIQGRRELRKSGGPEALFCPTFLENSLFIAFLCDNFLGFQKSGGGRGGGPGPLDPPVTTPLFLSDVVQVLIRKKYD